MTDMIKYAIQSMYLDKSIFKSKNVFLHYKGGVYVNLGGISADLSEKPLIAKPFEQALTYELFTTMMRVDTVPAYGKPEKHPLELGDIVIIYENDLHLEGIAVGKHRESKRFLCECGCGGETTDNEIFTTEWHQILSDDELTETAMKLNYILKY